MNKDLPKNTEKNGRDKNGRFIDGNNGKPKGATNKTTRDIREFITNFLNDKAFEIPHIWDAMDDRDKVTLYLHLCRLVMPKPIEEEPAANGHLKQPIWMIVDNSNKDIDPITGMEIVDSQAKEIKFEFDEDRVTNHLNSKQIDKP